MILSGRGLVIRLRPRPKRYIADSSAARLKVALRLYQAKEGKLPTNLAELVPHYLPSVPIDPFDGKPFRYRVSRGEDLIWLNNNPNGAGWPPMQAPQPPPLPPQMGGAPPGMLAGPPPQPTKTVPAGQGILWSVGEDGHDDRGRQHTTSTTSPGEDLIYLVPPPTQRK
jgi:hypothetical protein